MVDIQMVLAFEEHKLKDFWLDKQKKSSLLDNLET